MRAIAKVKETIREEDIPDTADLVILIEQCAADARSKHPRTRFLGARDHAILRILIEPGTPRATELCRTPLAALDMRAREIKYLGKGKRERYVPFGHKAGVALLKYLQVRGDQRGAAGPDLWLSTGGGTAGGLFTRSGLQQMLERRCARAGIRRIHPHQIRHYSADEWFAAGGSTGDAQKLFGWSNSAMADRYASKHAGRRARVHARELSLGDRVA
jgi:site-specific recombinase XerD